MAKPRKSRPGPAPHAPTPEQRKLVEQIAGYGIPAKDIASAMGIARSTLFKHYREELDRGLAVVNVQLGRSLVALAVGRPVEYERDSRGQPTKRIARAEMKPETQAAIFLSKIRLGYQDKVYVEVSFLDKYDLEKLNADEIRTLRAILAKAQRGPGPVPDGGSGTGAAGSGPGTGGIEGSGGGQGDGPAGPAGRD